MLQKPDQHQPRLLWLSKAFNAAAQRTSRQCGHASTFILACVIVVVWAVSGPAFHFSDTWQLVINTGTTIVTFLMVFLIQNTQNRDTTALHLKLDELIRVSKKARNDLLDLDNMTEKELETIKTNFTRLADKTPSMGASEDVADKSVPFSETDVVALEPATASKATNPRHAPANAQR